MIGLQQHVLVLDHVCVYSLPRLAGGDGVQGDNVRACAVCVSGLVLLATESSWVCGSREYGW